MNLPVFLWLILLPGLSAVLTYLVGRIVRQAKLWFLPYLTAVLALLASWIPFYLTAT